MLRNQLVLGRDLLLRTVALHASPLTAAGVAARSRATARRVGRWGLVTGLVVSVALLALDGRSHRG